MNYWHYLLRPVDKYTHRLLSMLKRVNGNERSVTPLCYTRADGKDRSPEKAFPGGRDGIHLPRLLCAHGAAEQSRGNSHQGSVSFLEHAAQAGEGARA